MGNRGEKAKNWGQEDHKSERQPSRVHQILVLSDKITVKTRQRRHSKNQGHYARLPFKALKTLTKPKHLALLPVCQGLFSYQNKIDSSYESRRTKQLLRQRNFFGTLVQRHLRPFVCASLAVGLIRLSRKQQSRIWEMFMLPTHRCLQNESRDLVHKIWGVSSGLQTMHTSTCFDQQNRISVI